MLPNNILTTSIYEKAEFLTPLGNNLLDYAWGGSALNDASQGLNVQLWTAFYEGGVIKVKTDTILPISIITVPSVTSLSLAFNQSMQITFAYVSNGLPYLYWYDTQVAAQVTTPLSPDVVTPKVSLDDNRNSQTGSSDIILAYIKANQLCMRVQRDRYTVEYISPEVLQAGSILKQIGMSSTLANELRFQFEVF